MRRRLTRASSTMVRKLETCPQCHETFQIGTASHPRTEWRHEETSSLVLTVSVDQPGTDEMLIVHQCQRDIKLQEQRSGLDTRCP